jgi:drug/metabolite transporter (DMT)-like permease
VVFDYWLNGSVLGGWQWLGAILLLTAITLVSLGGGRRSQAQPASG